MLVPSILFVGDRLSVASILSFYSCLDLFIATTAPVISISLRAAVSSGSRSSPARYRDLFLTVLEAGRRRYRVVVLGYVVMPGHFHLLLSEPQRGTPATVMPALKLGFSRRVLGEWKRRRGTNQPEFWEPPHQLWQPRFYDFNVWSERKLRRVAGV